MLNPWKFGDWVEDQSTCQKRVEGKEEDRNVRKVKMRLIDLK